MSFESLGLIAPIVNALTEQGYTAPSPIQEKAIPPALAGRDVLGCAQTGTGKTCAFATPILQRLHAASRPHAVRALILTPTRELAIQIGESFDDYGKHLPLRCAVIFGGVSQVPQVAALKKGVDILVATPGRLGDLYQQKLLDLSAVEIFVLDEADRMLDMGFIHDVKKIIRWLPVKKQTMLFSATMPEEVADLVNALLHDPARVAVNPVSSPVDAIDQHVYFVDRENKTTLLGDLVRSLDVKNALIFTRTKHGANKVARDLIKVGISAAAIHGNKSQGARQQALSDFKSGDVRCLVATDIAARGLDIEELSHVFNYNLPEVPETYIHRIGRTGRAGREGQAVALVEYGEKPLLKEIEKLMGRAIPVAESHPYPMQVLEPLQRDKNGRIVHPSDLEARASAKAKRAEPRPAKPDPARTPQPERPRGQATPSRPTAALGRAKGERPRGERPGTLMETGHAMPDPSVRRPNPLEGERVMDATARLLAPRPRPAQPAQLVTARQEKSAPTRQPVKNRGHRAPAETAAPSQQEEAAPRSRGGGRSKGKGQFSRKRPDSFDGHPASARTKDSTEQQTLMKPFYLDR